MTGRDRLVAIVVAAGVLLGGFWFFIIAPKRKEATALSAKVVVQEQRLLKARASVTAAQDSKARYDSDYAAVAALGQAVPADDDVPSLIVQVNRAADREKVDFRSLTADTSGTAPAAAPAAPAPAPAPAAPANGSDTGSSGGSADAQPATPSSNTAAPAPAAPAPTLPPGATVGAAGFPTMPFSFEFIGSFFRLEDFLHRLADFTTVRPSGNLVVRGRLLQVDSIELKAAPAGFPRVAASVKATAYVLPPGQGLTAGATAEGPATADSSASGATPSDSGGSAPAPTAAAALVTGGRR